MYGWRNGESSVVVQDSFTDGWHHPVAPTDMQTRDLEPYHSGLYGAQLPSLHLRARKRGSCAPMLVHTWTHSPIFSPAYVLHLILSYYLYLFSSFLFVDIFVIISWCIVHFQVVLTMNNKCILHVSSMYLNVQAKGQRAWMMTGKSIQALHLPASPFWRREKEKTNK